MLKPPQSTLSVAEAARIFRDAGIETRWAQCATEPELIPQFPDCSMPGPASLVMRIIPRPMARPKPSGPAAFGVALIPKDGSFGRFASVYIEAVAAIAGDDEALGARMLGHLMSHELGHLLLGKQSHSRRGIMRADWLEKDLQDARQGRFLFTTQQASNMRGAMAGRDGAALRAPASRDSKGSALKTWRTPPAVPSRASGPPSGVSTFRHVGRASLPAIARTEVHALEFGHSDVASASCRAASAP